MKLILTYYTYQIRFGMIAYITHISHDCYETKSIHHLYHKLKDGYVGTLPILAIFK